MRTLTIPPLSIGLVPRADRAEGASKTVPRMLLDTSSGTPAPRRARGGLLQVVPASTEPVHDVEAALLKLQDSFFASCVDYPADEQLQERIGKHCRQIEANLRPEDLRAWRSGRDCLLARLGFRLLPE